MDRSVLNLILVHLDADLIVVNKPAGLLSVPGRGVDKQDCVVHRLQAHGHPEALTVHRLDMATSGLLLLARGTAAQRALSMAFEARQVGKRYVAVVQGLMEIERGWRQIDLPLLTDWPKRPRQMVDHARGKPSITRWRALSHDATASTTRLELEPLTGRTHQLRVHLLAIGHPILGDALYGPQPPAHARLHLHACHLSLPERGLTFDCPPDF